jgi:hypothetical protein
MKGGPGLAFETWGLANRPFTKFRNEFFLTLPGEEKLGRINPGNVGVFAVGVNQGTDLDAAVPPKNSRT